jgi:hypothetical protein
MTDFDIRTSILEVIECERKEFCIYLLDQIQEIMEGGGYDTRSFIAIVAMLNQEIEKLKKRMRIYFI